MNNKTSHLIRNQVPSFVRADYPKFLEFLEAYYDFIDTQRFDPRDIIDVDRVAQQFLLFFYKEFASKFPKSVIDERRLLKTIRELYTAKGTIDGVKLLFRLFFGDDVVIRQPGENILRASDGRWFQYKFVDAEILGVSTGLDDRYKTLFLKFENEFGRYNLPVEWIEIIAINKIRVYFKSFLQSTFEDHQELYICDSEDNPIVKGTLVQAPTGLQILNPGKYWQKGQLITLSGTKKDTIGRVLEIGPNGEIEKLEIIEYGFTHILNGPITVSPFPQKPVSASYSYEVEYISVDPLVREHKLTINDSVDEFTERIQGIADSLTADSYFLQDYAEESYAGAEVISFLSSYVASTHSNLLDPSLTLDMWLESRATINFTRNWVSKTRGVYEYDNGQLSNPEIRLQDNYYYQMFSYLIETTVNINKYRDALQMIHPAGLKFFANLNKIKSLDVSGELDAYSTFSSGARFIFDEIDLADEISFAVTSYREEEVEVTDNITSISTTKIVSELSEPTDEITFFDVTKGIVDASSPWDSISSIEIGKLLTEQVVPSDSLFVSNNKVIAESTTPEDILFTTVNKAISDSINISDGDSFVVAEILYASENYFAEDYVSIEKTLTIT